MAQLTAQRIKDALKGLFSGLDATDNGYVQDAFNRRFVGRHVTDGGTAGTAQGESPLWMNTTAISYLVVSAYFFPGVSVTADNTNYASPFVIRRDSAGINNVTVGTFTTQITGSGNLTAYLPFAMTLTAANLVVAPGQVLTCSITKTASGVAIGSATVQSMIFAWLEPTN